MNIDPHILIDDPVWIELWTTLADVEFFSDIEPRQHVKPPWKNRSAGYYGGAGFYLLRGTARRWWENDTFIRRRYGLDEFLEMCQRQRMLILEEEKRRYKLLDRKGKRMEHLQTWIM